MTENNNSKPIRTSRDEVIIDGVDVKNCKGIDLGLFPLCKCKFLKFKTSDDGIAGIWCSDHTNCYFKQLVRKTQECEQTEQKLERIGEVAKQMNNECFYDDFECKDCDMKNGCTYFNKSKILQIIDEVEND